MAKTKEFKKYRLTLPKGVLKFPWLTTPDRKFDAGGQFRTGVLYEPDDPAFKAFQERVQEILDEYLDDNDLRKLIDAERKPINVRLPWREDEKKVGEDEYELTGLMEVRCSQDATKEHNGKTISFTVDLIDAKKHPLPEDVGVFGGSVARIGVDAFGYGPLGPERNVGVSMRMRAVQVLELKTGGSSAADYDFEEEEGYSMESEDEDDF